jgi:hypothetical protein
MKFNKEHIAALKEQYEHALSVAFSQAADEASRKYGIPLSKLPVEMIRSVASSNPMVKQRLDEWLAASAVPHDDTTSTDVDWLLCPVPGYKNEQGEELSIAEAMKDVSERLERSRETIRNLVDTIQRDGDLQRGFWLSVVMETATLIRVEAGESLTILTDIAIASRGNQKNEILRGLTESARVIRDDAKSIIDLSRAKQGLL